ncbi:MAG: anaerobic ribonucleoside-triphosphate reductase activating protein [Clostridia bacterium]|nr:anaerobic ribonucleoside-triphosphate reductase activating protein [Clostridia bacterium]
MNYADIKRVDVANGPGVRVSLFVSGCTHHCVECFNPETWDFNFGVPFGEEQIQEILGYLRPAHIKGLSLLGGEPFEPENQQAVLELVKRVREELPEKDIWCYTGYLFEQLSVGQVGSHSRALLERLDVLVDGPFVLARKNLGLRFRGSDNQRIIEVKESLDSGAIVLWEDGQN